MTAMQAANDVPIHDDGALNRDQRGAACVNQPVQWSIDPRADRPSLSGSSSAGEPCTGVSSTKDVEACVPAAAESSRASSKTYDFQCEVCHFRIRGGTSAEHAAKMKAEHEAGKKHRKRAAALQPSKSVSSDNVSSLSEPAYSAWDSALVSKLGADVQSAVGRLDMSEDERAAERAAALQRVSTVVRRCLDDGCTPPSVEVHLLGSVATGLAVDSSDLDLTVISLRGTGSVCGRTKALETSQARQSRVADLHRIRGAVQQAGLVSRLSTPMVLPYARVPILKFCEAASGLHVDVSIEQPDGLRSRDWQLRELGRRPELRPLLIVLKRFLALNGLGDTATGGVGSYLLFAMAHSLVATGTGGGGASGGGLGGEAGLQWHLGAMLLDFLCRFRTTACASDGTEPHWCVFDPLAGTEAVDLGKKAWRAPEISARFGRCYDLLVAGEVSIGQMVSAPLARLEAPVETPVEYEGSSMSHTASSSVEPEGSVEAPPCSWSASSVVTVVTHTHQVDVAAITTADGVPARTYSNALEVWRPTMTARPSGSMEELGDFVSLDQIAAPAAPRKRVASEERCPSGAANAGEQQDAQASVGLDQQTGKPVIKAQRTCVR